MGLGAPGEGTVDGASNNGLTRREALRRGAFLGAGLVWMAPQVKTLTLSATTAAQASPVNDTQTETLRQPTGTTQPGTQVAGIQVEPPGPTTVGGSQLPFTGLPLDQVAPIAGGLLAAGGASILAAKNRKPGRHERGSEGEPAE